MHVSKLEQFIVILFQSYTYEIASPRNRSVKVDFSSIGNSNHSSSSYSRQTQIQDSSIIPTGEAYSNILERVRQTMYTTGPLGSQDRFVAGGSISGVSGVGGGVGLSRGYSRAGNLSSVGVYGPVLNTGMMGEAVFNGQSVGMSSYSGMSGTRIMSNGMSSGIGMSGIGMTSDTNQMAGGGMTVGAGQMSGSGMTAGNGRMSGVQMSSCSSTSNAGMSDTRRESQTNVAGPLTVDGHATLNTDASNGHSEPEVNGELSNDLDMIQNGDAEDVNQDMNDDPQSDEQLNADINETSEVSNDA